MNYTRNAVYSRVVSDVRAAHADVYCTSRYALKPAEFPCLFLREIDRYPRRNAMTLDATDEQAESTFEAQVFSNLAGNAQIEALAITETVETAFRALFYRQLSQTVLDDGNTYTVITRYRRVVGGGDTFPE